MRSKVSKKIKIAAVLVLIMAAALFLVLPIKHISADTPQYMEVTTIESVIPAGLGRSKMITVGADGKTDKADMKNLYSLTGINFGNVTQNMQDVLTKINSLTSQGWELISVTSNSESPNDNSNKGIFMTCYLFRKS